MSDPLSVTASVSSLVVISAKIIKNMYDFYHAYADAPLAISSIASECTIIQASLAALQGMLLDNPGASSLPASAVQALDMSLVGCALTLSVIDKDIRKCVQATSQSPGRALTRNALYIFEKAHFEELLQQIRGHQLALTLLLTTMQARSMSELKQSAEVHHALLEKIAERARSLWQESQDGRNTPDTVMGSEGSVFGLSSVSDTRFDFDSIIMRSQAYRRSTKTLKQYNTRKHVSQACKDPVDQGYASRTAGEGDVVREDPDPALAAAQASASAPGETGRRSILASDVDTVSRPSHGGMQAQSLPYAPNIERKIKRKELPLNADPDFLPSTTKTALSSSTQSINELQSGPHSAAAMEATVENAERSQDILPEVVIQRLTDHDLTTLTPATVTPRPNSAIGLALTTSSRRIEMQAPSPPHSPSPTSSRTPSPEPYYAAFKSTSKFTASTAAITLEPISLKISGKSVSPPEMASPIPLEAVVIGDGYVGKTALCQMLTAGTYWVDRHNRDPPNLHRAAFWHSGHEYDLTFSDQPGDLWMSGRARSPINNTNVVLMCFAVDHVDSLENLEYVLKPLLNGTYLGVPALLIGCKTDLRDSHTGPYHNCLVPTGQAQTTQAVLQAVDYLECSAATSKNLTDVLISVAHWAMQHQAMQHQSKSRGMFKRASISRFLRQPMNQILEHRCDFRR